jgi:hypothetical protein
MSDWIKKKKKNHRSLFLNRKSQPKRQEGQNKSIKRKRKKERNRFVGY